MRLVESILVPESLSAHNAEQLLHWIQVYWGIKTAICYWGDGILGVDGTRTTNKCLAEPMPILILNNFVVTLSQKLRLTIVPYTRRQFDDLSSEFYSRVHDY